MARRLIQIRVMSKRPMAVGTFVNKRHVGFAAH